MASNKKRAAAEKPLPLADRIEALHKEIEAKIEQYLELIKPSCPGIPIGVLRQTSFARAHGCKCAEHKLLMAKN
jgi:hypothetical protein